jgi:ABC-2 type transport system permease protein
MYAGFWPSLSGNTALADAMTSYPDAIKQAFHMEDLTTATGYFNATVFGILVPILTCVFAISVAVKAIAADEEAGTLDLTLAHPVGRLSVALQRYAALVGGLVAACALVLVVLLALRDAADFASIPVGNLAATAFQLALLGFCVGSITFAVGAFTGKRALTLGVGAGVTVVAYLADSFAPSVKSLKWLEQFSPFDWYLGGSPLSNGLQVGDCALLIGVGLVAAAIGLWRFRERDLSV